MPLGASRINFLSKSLAVAATPDYTVPTSAFTEDASTIALYHLDNADTDAGPLGLDFNTSGGFSSGTKKFGTHSGDLTQTGDYFQYNTSGRWGPVDGNGNPRDYTLECFVYYDSLTGASQTNDYLTNLMQPLGDQAGTSYIWFGLNSSGKLALSHYNVVNIQGTDTFATGEWHHIALTFDTSDNKYRGYCDGFLQFTSGAVTLTASNTPSFKSTYGLANAGDTDGYIDEIRLSSAVRYPTYTEPTFGTSLNLAGGDYGYIDAPSEQSGSNSYSFFTWVKFDSSNAGDHSFITESFRNGKSALRVQKQNTKFMVDMYTSTNSQLWRAQAASTFTADTWYAVWVAMDPSNTSRRDFYYQEYGSSTVTQVSSSNNTLWTNNTGTWDTLYYDSTKDIGIGARGANGAVAMRGDLAEFWLDIAYHDFGSSSNRQKFVTADGLPLSLGSDGSTPFSAAPEIYLAGSDILTNNRGDSGDNPTYSGSPGTGDDVGL